VSVDSAESGSESKRDKDGYKENLPPRRKPKKVVSAPNSSEFTMIGPDAKQRELEKMGKSRSTPVTPNKFGLGTREGNFTPTPRGHRLGPIRDLGSPYRTTPVSSQKQRKEMRRLLEDEADEVGGDGDC
jgi:hypothetical protein